MTAMVKPQHSQRWKTRRTDSFNDDRFDTPLIIGILVFNRESSSEPPLRRERQTPDQTFDHPPQTTQVSLADGAADALLRTAMLNVTSNTNNTHTRSRRRHERYLHARVMSLQAYSAEVMSEQEEARKTPQTANHRAQPHPYQQRSKNPRQPRQHRDRDWQVAWALTQSQGWLRPNVTTRSQPRHQQNDWIQTHDLESLHHGMVVVAQPAGRRSHHLRITATLGDAQHASVLPILTLLENDLWTPAIWLDTLRDFLRNRHDDHTEPTASYPPDRPSDDRRPNDRTSNDRRPDDHHRIDARALPFVTIDGSDARDFDDAVAVEPLGSHATLDASLPHDLIPKRGQIPKQRQIPEGEQTLEGWRCHVAIADVATEVSIGSVYDQHAARMGNSFYLPDRVLPMLPAHLSEGACSLVPHEDRRVVLFSFLVDAIDGNPRDLTIKRAWIRSRARLDYVRLGTAPSCTTLCQTLQLDPQVAQSLESLKTVSQRLIARADTRGMLQLNLPDLTVTFEDHAHPSALTPISQYWSHRAIEMLMIATNNLAARWLSSRQIPFIHRHHGAPAVRDDTAWVQRLRALAGRPLHSPELDAIVSQRNSARHTNGLVSSAAKPHPQPYQRRDRHDHDRHNRHDRHRRKEPTTDKTILSSQAVIAAIRAITRAFSNPHKEPDPVEAKVRQQLATQAILQAQSPAAHRTASTEHTGLALRHYGHFTSPIRRYADLVNHRQLLATFDQIDPPYRADILDPLCLHLDAQERIGCRVERTLMQRYKAFLTQNLQGVTVAAIATDVIPNGVFFRLIEPHPEWSLEGFLPRDNIPSHWRLSSSGEAQGLDHQNLITVGKRITVAIVGVDPLLGHIRLAIPSRSSLTPHVSVPTKGRLYRRIRTQQPHRNTAQHNPTSN